MKLYDKAKRKLIQIAAFGFTNVHMENLAAGKLYQGPWKHFCCPGLNCYSCPAATFACPVGALQAVAGSSQFQMSFYAVGFLLAFGVLLGRAVCGFLCPFGLLQELLHKIPFPKRKLPRVFGCIKYGILLIFVILLPIAATNFMGMGFPAFCAYICPAGTLEGGIPLLLARSRLRGVVGPLFCLKAAILLLTLLGCLSVYRFFCKALCPLGAIYGLLNKISVYHLEVDADRCIHCGKCVAACKMDADPLRHPDSAACIRCGDCRDACPVQAIRLGFRRSGRKH